MCSSKSCKSLPDHIHMASDLRLADIGGQLPVNLSFPFTPQINMIIMSPQKKGPFW